MQSGRLLSASMHGFRNSQICQKEYDMNNQTSVKGLSQKLKKAMLKSRSSLSSAFRLKTALMKPLAKDVQEDAADEEK